MAASIRLFASTFFASASIAAGETKGMVKRDRRPGDVAKEVSADLDHRIR
jgi:fructose-1,6-bisphosphatase/inositol monophosphatase family enzyme